MSKGLTYVATTRNGAAFQIHAATDKGAIRTLDISKREALRIIAALAEEMVATEPRDRQ